VPPTARRDLATNGQRVVERAGDTIVSITLTPTTMTLSRVVDFEVILDVSRRGRAGDELSIALGVEQGHGAFGEVSAFAGLPFVVDVGQHGADEADDAGFVGAPLCQAKARSWASRASASMAS
jgi:hypothetical protein